MDMKEFVDFLSRIILLTIVFTIVLAILTYVAYKVRSARKGPKSQILPSTAEEENEYIEPMLFEKYSPTPEKQDEK